MGYPQVEAMNITKSEAQRMQHNHKSWIACVNMHLNLMVAGILLINHVNSPVDTVG